MMQPLFNVQCRHDYYASGLCAALTLVPSAACARQLSRNQLYFRSQEGGGAVYYRAGASPLAQFSESAPLAFWLINSEPTLLGMTDIGSQATGLDGLFYFDNLQGAAGTGTNLNPPGALNTPLLPSRPARFSEPFATPMQDAVLTVCSRLTGSTVWQTRSPAARLGSAPLVLDTLAEGRYQLNLDGSPLLDFWLGAAPANAWGVVAIYPGGAGQTDHVPTTACALDAQGQVTPLSYTITLHANSLAWRYHLIGATKVDFTQYELVASRKTGDPAPVNFSGSTEAPIDGRPSFRFVAQQPLPLQQRPGDMYTVQLRSKPDARHAATWLLPYPRPCNLSALENGARYADVYVYL